MSERDTLALLERFAGAWNRHDVDTLLDCMLDDGTFYSSAGPSPDGASAEGLASLRKAYTSIWETFPDARWDDARHFVA